MAEEKGNDERSRRLRMRNWALFGVLATFVIIVYIVSIVRMGGGE